MTVQVVIPSKTIFDNIYTAAQYISWYAERRQMGPGRLDADDSKHFHAARAYLRELRSEIDTIPERAAWYTEVAALSKGLNKLSESKRPDWQPLRTILEELTGNVSNKLTNSDWKPIQKSAEDLMSLCSYLDDAVRKQIDAAAAKHLTPLVALLH